MTRYHKELLTLIEQFSGKATQHTFSDAYLGNAHPRYPISVPVLRKLAREWMRAYSGLSVKEFVALLGSLARGKSSTEKVTSGILTDYCTTQQLIFPPKLFNEWLEHLDGWAE